MRIDGLTTAKMLAIVTLMSFNRRIKLGHDAEEEIDNLQQKTNQLKKEVEKGISKARFIVAAKEMGFPEIKTLFKKDNYLEFWNEEHEYIFHDRAIEDDGSSAKVETKPELGFVGMRQIEAEKQAAE